MSDFAIDTFAAVNVMIGAIFAGTLWLLVRGTLFPQMVAVVQEATKAALESPLN